MKRLILFLCCPFVLCAANQGCPWMNAASAGGYLETTARAVAAPSGDTGICEFTGQRGTARLDLWIEVKTLADLRLPACGANTEALKAIGNEAVVCGHQPTQSGISQQVVGRVRNRGFTVRITSSDATARPGDLRAAVKRAAEQVAGNLF